MSQEKIDCDNERIELEIDLENRLESMDDNFESYGTIHSINQWSYKNENPMVVDMSLTGPDNSPEHGPVHSSRQYNVKKSKCYRKKSFPWFIITLSAVIALIGIYLILIGSIPSHTEYNKIDSIEYTVIKTNEKYCSSYDTCFWSCCLPQKNESMCPKISSSLFDILNSFNNDSHFFCERRGPNIGTKCGSKTNSTKMNTIQCCQGGPCQEEKPYWKTQCTYKLSGSRNTNIIVALNHLFLNENEARNSFLCSTGIYTIDNRTVTQFPVYLPTKGYEFKINSPINFSNCPYESSTVQKDCVFTTEILFDQIIVYSMNSWKFYNNYLKSLQYYLFGGSLMVIISLLLLPTVFLIKNECKNKHFLRYSTYKIVPVLQINNKNCKTITK